MPYASPVALQQQRNITVMHGLWGCPKGPAALSLPLPHRSWQRHTLLQPLASALKPQHAASPSTQHPSTSASSGSGTNSVTGSSVTASTIEQLPAKLWGRRATVAPQAAKEGRAQATLPATSKTTSVVSRKGSGASGKGPEDDEQETWGLLDLSRYGERWDVPWDAKTLIGGMALWLGAFVGVGFIGVPYLYKLAGVNIFTASPEERTSFALVAQLAETAVTLLLVRRLTAQRIAQAEKDPSSTASTDLFIYDPRQPFAKPRGWLAWGLLGVALSPVVVVSVATLVSEAGYDSSVGGAGTVDSVAGMLTMDATTYLSLVAVAGVLAPLLEETVFRGFMLTSLTKYMPVWAAVALSSVAFGLCHLSPRDLPVLTALGCLLGVLYVRSRNLLTPILVHGVWNSGVITLLFALTSSGVDVAKLIDELRG